MECYFPKKTGVTCTCGLKIRKSLKLLESLTAFNIVSTGQSLAWNLHIFVRNHMYRIIFSLLLFSFSVLAQNTNPYDKYGPFGAEVHKDLKAALKLEKGVFKMDLSYIPIEPKLWDKLGKLTDLQVLHLNSNPVQVWPSTFANLKNLVYLASFNNPFTSFPPELSSMRQLMYLEMFGTKIDSIPIGINALARLKVFKFSSTNDTLRLPRTLKFLKSLNELTVESVVLDSCPRVLFRLPALKFMSMSNTAIQAMPEDLGKMSNLEVLILENNKLTAVPREIYKMPNLIHLSLKGNQITKIPDTICHLQSLTRLDLRDNPIPKEDIEELKALLPGCRVIF